MIAPKVRRKARKRCKSANNVFSPMQSIEKICYLRKNSLIEIIFIVLFCLKYLRSNIDRPKCMNKISIHSMASTVSEIKNIRVHIL